jgi:hypothetical protein
VTRRKSRRIVIGFEQLLAASETIRRQHVLWTSDGYVVSGARLFRCGDGSITARVVWRNRGSVISTVTCTVRGLALA